MQICKSVRAAVMICDRPTLPHTDTQTHSQANSQTDRQTAADQFISSAVLANKNSECVILMTSFITCMAFCYMKVFRTQKRHARVHRK